jgi:tRNA(Ile)-lysidine synthase
LWISPDIKQRFLAGLEACGFELCAQSRLCLAVSGGPDSLALLLLGHACIPNQIAAATVDHGLRAEAQEEAAYVADICSQFGVEHIILTPPSAITGNIQSSARKARYALLEQWAGEACCSHIATAHHADDQLETILMRLARGSGIDGISGVRAVNRNIIRPLLDFAKSELNDICKSAGVSAVQDPSNTDPDFDRVRMRNWLAQNTPPFTARAAGRSAAALAQASEALNWMAYRLKSERITITGDILQLDTRDLPQELQRRLLLLALAYFEPETPFRGDVISRALRNLSAGLTLTIGNILCKGGQLWKLSPAPPRNISE